MKNWYLKICLLVSKSDVLLSYITLPFQRAFLEMWQKWLFWVIYHWIRTLQIYIYIYIYISVKPQDFVRNGISKYRLSDLNLSCSRKTTITLKLQKLKHETLRTVNEITIFTIQIIQNNEHLHGYWNPREAVWLSSP